MNSFEDILKAITGVTKTQQDINKIASASQYAQSPEVQNAITLGGQLLTAQLFLQTVSTVAIVVLAWVAVKNRKK